MKDTKKMREKKDLLIQDILGRITRYQLTSVDDAYFNWIEDLRENIVNFRDGREVSDTCEKCGCTEFLCGHNERS